jgi:AraC-like DNA-binding protein
MVTWLAETYDLDRLDKAWTTVAGAALALVRPAPGVSVRLPRPSDPAVARIADAVSADPSDPRSIEEWGDILAISPRTLRRRVQAETGLSYRDWRRYLALTVAAEKLLTGARVTGVAFEAGYATSSAFVAAFHKAFQVTPGQFQKLAEG